MTLIELKEAVDTLLADPHTKDEHVHIEVNGACYELKSISVIVQSDVWVPNTVVASVEEIDSEEGA